MTSTEHSPSGHRQGCHVGREASVGDTSTGYFVLVLCAALVLGGLVATGVIPLPFVGQ